MFTGVFTQKCSRDKFKATWKLKLGCNWVIEQDNDHKITSKSPAEWLEKKRTKVF